jgi:putative addiction module component (TIGR02574 family)
MVDVTSFLSSLSPAEKLKLIGDLWDDLSSDPQNVPWHDWHKEELDRRKADLLQNPDAVLTEEELKSRLRERRGR